MPCSCGNTSCPCGIPCCCSEELCKCHDCAIALQRICKVCNKQLTTEKQTDEEACSCFIGESTALILDNLQCRLGNVPKHLGYSVSGKLVVNVMIPIPAVQYPHIIPKQPFFSMPRVPSVADHSKISLISDTSMVNSLDHTENLPFPTSEPHNLLSKNNDTTSDYDLSSQGSNCEKNSEICHPPRFLQSTDNAQTGNEVQNTKFETEANSNLQQTIFCLPSVIINNISYSVEMKDPVWRLPNPDGCIASNIGSTLNIRNPFYMARPIPTTATYENEFTQYAPYPNFVAKDIRFFSENQDGNKQPESSASLKIDEKTLDSTLLLQQPDLIISDENVEAEVSSNNATGYKCIVPPYSETFDTLKQSGISANYSIPDQSQPCSTSTSEKNYFLPSPDISNPSGISISGNVHPESTGDLWQGGPWCSPLPEIPVLTCSIPLNPTATSRLQQLFNPSSQENNYFPRGLFTSTSEDERQKENLPLYLDASTTQNIEKMLK